LSQALLAAVTTPVVMCATFDMFSFSMCTGLYFLLLGCLGALERLTGDRRETRTAATDLALGSTAARLRRVRLGASVGALAAVVATLFAMVPGALHANEYEAGGTVLLGTQDDTSKPYATAFSTWTDSQLIVSHLRSASLGEALRSQGLGVEIRAAVGDGSLMPQTDHDGYGAVVRYSVRAASQDIATRAGLAVRVEIAAYLERLETQVGAPSSLWIVVKDVVAPGNATLLPGSRSRALAGLGGITIAEFFLMHRLLLYLTALVHRFRASRLSLGDSPSLQDGLTRA
jgi:hypothetical protein